MRSFRTVVNDATAISTTTIQGVDYVNIHGTKVQIKKGSVTFPAAATATAAGTAGTAIITFAGTYVVGDIVRVTLSLPGNSGQRIVKSYSLDVVTATVTAVASFFADAITADIAAGALPDLATASNVAGVLTLTQSSVFQEVIGDAVNTGVVLAYTDSALGTAVVTDTATTIEYGTPAALINEGVDASAIGLASYSTVLLVNKTDAAIPFIDSEGKTVQEIKFFSTPAITAALIAAL